MNKLIENQINNIANKVNLNYSLAKILVEFVQNNYDLNSIDVQKITIQMRNNLKLLQNDIEIMEQQLGF